MTTPCGGHAGRQGERDHPPDRVETTDDDVERRERDLGAPAARVAVSVAHPGAGGAAGPGPPVRDGGGAAGRQRARSAEGRDPGLAALPAGGTRLLRHHGAGRARWSGARRLRVLHGQRGAGPGLDVDREHPGPLAGPRDGGGRRRAPRRAPRPQRPWRVDRRDRAVRARRRLGPGRRLHPRGARRRRVGGDRPQALVRQREGGGLHPGAGTGTRSRAGRVAVHGPGEPAPGEEARRVPPGG
jgi:hypothetical protein